MHMKEKSSFTTETTIDYTKTKDAYDGKRETSAYRDSSLPEDNKRHRDDPSGE